MNPEEFMQRFAALAPEEQFLIDDAITPELARVLVKLIPEVSEVIVAAAQINLDKQQRQAIMQQNGGGQLPQQAPAAAPAPAGPQGMPQGGGALGGF